MNQQFEASKPLAKKLANVCDQINTNLVFYALVDVLAGVVLTLPENDVEAISEEVMKIFMAQVKNYQAIKASKPKRRRKRTQTIH